MEVLRGQLARLLEPGRHGKRRRGLELEWACLWIRIRGFIHQFLGLEAYSWSEDDKWRFTFGEATTVDEDPEAEISWRFAILRETEDEQNEDGSASGGATGIRGVAPVVGAPDSRVPLQIPPAIEEAIRRSLGSR